MERNNRCFEGKELSSNESNNFFFKTLFSWDSAVIYNGSNFDDFFVSLVSA